MAMCADCKQPLIIFIDPDSDIEENTAGEALDANQGRPVDDDVELECGCHFHWQCLLDAYSLTECPNCGRNLLHDTQSGEQQLLCNLKNEGGLQERLNILPLLTEESYLKAYPEERRCRAFLEFCEQGDVEAIVNCLHYVDDDSESENVNDLNKEIDILRYRDSLGTLGSGLHFAIGNNRIEVVWLLLYLASNLEFSQFPADVLLALHRSGLERENSTGKMDIRSLKDGEGLTAGQRAMRLGGIWVPWIESGRLMV